MIDGLVFVFELGLGALVLVLAYRVAELARSEPVSFTPMATIDRTELYTQLHILIGLQQRDCREQGLDWLSTPPEVSQYAVAWLCGAACALCETSVRHTAGLNGLVAHIASRKTRIRQPEAVQTLSTLTHNNTWLACFRHGLDAAEHWRTYRFVPPHSSLYGAITNNAFI